MFFTLACLYLTVDLFGQSYISGEINQNTRWRGEVYIDGDVTIPQGVTLTVEEGTKVYFKPKTDSQKSGKDKQRSELLVNGVIIAQSNNTFNPIVFTSASKNPQMNDWYGIIIKNFFDPSVLQNCTVEFGYRGVTCYGSSPLITGGEYKFNHNSGISCEVKSNPVISNSLIFGNGFSGINCELASNPVISGCTLSENNFGVIIFSKSTPDLGAIPRAENKSRGENRLSNNFENDVYNHSASTIYAQNNSWISTRPQDIQKAIYDRIDNSSYGEVIFQPIYVERRAPYKIAALSPLVEEQANRDSIALGLALADTATKDTTNLIVQLQTTNVVLQETRSQQANFSAPPQETLIASREPTPQTPPPIQEPVIQEPVLEAFLDSGKRQYARRVIPKYPEIYLQTGTQGDVLIEVLVNRSGEIENYRILKSDGDLFTEASVEALEKFKYQPGKIGGKPVKFKIIERFRFKLN